MLINSFFKLSTPYSKSLTKIFQRAWLSAYTQGQIVPDKDGNLAREYFYYLDHQGQLFLDDTKIKNFTSCYKEQAFLDMFFRNLRLNQNKYKNEFPYVSMCNNECNYLKCEDLPFVVTHLDPKNDLAQLNNLVSVNWAVYFSPHNLYHHARTGRLYYLFEDKQIILDKSINEKEITNESLERARKKYSKLPVKVGLVKSNIALDILKTLEIENSENGSLLKFIYKSAPYVLNSSKENKIYPLVKQYSSLKDHN